MSNQYNFIIIGAGPSGTDAALALRKTNQSVLLIEKDKWGGTCLHQGCIPTKALIHYSSQPFNGDLPALFSKVFTKVTAISENLLANLLRNGVNVLTGEAQVLDASRVKVGDTIYTADHIVYAAGSLPIVPRIIGLDMAGVYTSESIYSLTTLPKHLAIIGGGYIGFEWANIFMNLGSQVTIYETQPQVLSGFDDDIRRRLLSTLRTRPLTIKTNVLITEFVKSESGIAINFNDGNSADHADAILVAVGRKAPNIALPKGVIKIGDVEGPPYLAHKASAQGRALVDAGYYPNIVPSAMFTEPEIALTGYSEGQLKQLQIEYLTFKLPYRANSKAFVIDHDDGFVKLITDINKEYLLGAAIIGYQASNIISLLTLAIQEKIPIEKLKHIIFPHPTIGEIVGQALEAI
ncbi:MAG TPA: NAD(P)/FAD-dependent oxidoreductase [Bacilli bacterium]|nr:NAD(P)/FAD-dependent oxidoreductase [Bacilli bacterium]